MMILAEANYVNLRIVRSSVFNFMVKNMFKWEMGGKRNATNQDGPTVVSACDIYGTDRCLSKFCKECGDGALAGDDTNPRL